MVTIDFINEVKEYPKEGTTGPIRRTRTDIGGQVGRAALSCARLGAKTTLAGMVGQGVYADLLRAQLGQELLDAHLIMDVAEAGSQHSFITLSGDTGERTILWTPQPRATSACLDVCAALIPHATCVLLDTTDLALATTMAKQCREYGVPSVIDTGSYKPEADELLAFTDHIIAPEKFFQARAAAYGISYRDAILDVMGRFSPTLIVSTEGERGGVYLERDNQEIRRYSPTPVKVVDSCGAGDVFHGGFAYALAQGWPISQALDFSTWLAAQKCTQFGNAGLPTAAEIPARFTASE
jgi:sugar/nucleoside kinase (ribokinase family)